MTEPTIKTSDTADFTNKEQIKHKAIKLLKQAKSIRHTAPAESLKLAKEALNISTQNQSYSIAAQTHSLLGKLALEATDINQASYHFLQSSLIFKSVHDTRREIISSLNYTNMLVADKRYIQANVISDELLSIAKNYGNNSLTADVLMIKGDACYQQKQYANAITQHLEALTYLPSNDVSAYKKQRKNYRKIAQSYKHLKAPEKSIFYFKKVLDISTMLSDRKSMASALNAIATAERYLNNLVISLEYSIRSLDIYKQIDDIKGRVKALGTIGITYRLLGNYEKSLEHIYETHLYYKSIKDIAGIAESSNQMGFLYIRLEQYEQARSFYQVTIDLPEHKIKLMTLATALREMASLDLKTQKYDSAMLMAQSAKQIYINEKTPEKESIATQIIANIYAEKNNYNQSITSFREALLLTKNASTLYKIKAQTNLAKSLIGKHTNEAVTLLKNSLTLSQRLNNQEQALYATQALKKAEKQRNNIGESLRYAEEEISLIKALHNKKDTRKLMQAKASLNSHKLEVELKNLKEKAKVNTLELAKKNNEIEIAEQANTIHELQSIKNRYATIALTSLLIFCIVLVIYIYRRFADSKKKNIELDYLATHDPLTNCYNRRVLFEFMNRDYLDKALLGEYCVIMLDIDFFKDVNDNYGHHTGDKVLQGISKILQGTIRQNDIAARYGGEEFCIVLPGAPQEQAIIIAETLREKIQSTHFDTINVTCSFGIASIHHNAEDPEALIKQADSALYKSKSAGRNQVTLWNETIT